jgi:hypothetical protein
MDLLRFHWSTKSMLFTLLWPGSLFSPLINGMSPDIYPDLDTVSA